MHLVKSTEISNCFTSRGLWNKYPGSAAVKLPVQNSDFQRRTKFIYLIKFRKVSKMFASRDLLDIYQGSAVVKLPVQNSDCQKRTKFTYISKSTFLVPNPSIHLYPDRSDVSDTSDISLPKDGEIFFQPRWQNMKIFHSPFVPGVPRWWERLGD